MGKEVVDLELATPRPWLTKADRRRWNPNYIESANAHIADILPCSVNKKSDLEAIANAALIVAAVNAYDPAREALIAELVGAATSLLDARETQAKLGLRADRIRDNASAYSDAELEAARDAEVDAILAEGVAENRLRSILAKTAEGGK